MDSEELRAQLRAELAELRARHLADAEWAEQEADFHRQLAEHAPPVLTQIRGK